MSCPKKRSDKNNKPKRTKYMIKRKIDYVWRELPKNPNIFCWIPMSKKQLAVQNKLEDIPLDELSIQDIPEVDLDKYEDEITDIAEETLKNKYREGLKKLQNNPTTRDLVSVDDPKKYKIVKDFIMQKGRKIYGGTAIDAYLPPEAKIYEPDQLPDYDFFSPDPWNDAVELATILYKNGYIYAEAKAGIHKGTYKVYANFWPVADITFIPKSEFEKIEVTVINGMPVVSPFKLLESLYKEFSEPFVNPTRWPKVSVREKLLQKWVNPLGNDFNCSTLLFHGENIKLSSIHKKLLEICYVFILEKGLIFTDSIAYNTYIEIGGGLKRVAVDHLRVLSETAHTHIQELFTQCLKITRDITILTEFIASRELNQTNYIICHNESNICIITQLTSCTPIKNILGRKVVAIDYLKYDLFDSAVFSETEQERNDYKCKLQYLTKIQERYYKNKKLKEVDISPFQRFVKTCVGPFQENIKVEFLNRWLDKTAERNTVIREWNAKYRIRKYTREPIQPECMNKEKEACEYPCAWNPYINKCTGIPKGGFKPGDIDIDYLYEYE